MGVGNKRCDEELPEELQLDALGRVIHNVLFNIVLSRTGSRDHISEKDYFVFFHLEGKPINMPSLILEHWETTFKGKFVQKRSKEQDSYSILHVIHENYVYVWDTNRGVVHQRK